MAVQPPSLIQVQPVISIYPDLSIPLTDDVVANMPEAERVDRLAHALKQHLPGIFGRSDIKAGLVMAILNSSLQKGEVRKFEKLAVLLLKHPRVFEFLFCFSQDGNPIPTPPGIKNVKVMPVSAALNGDDTTCEVLVVLNKEKSLEKADTLLKSDFDNVLNSVRKFKGNLQKWWKSL